MKPTLERTSITCKDLAEQPARRYILILPEQNVAVSCDDVQMLEGGIVGMEKDSDEPLISVNQKIDWILLRNDVAEMQPRGEALKRTVTNQIEEGKYLKKLIDEAQPKDEKSKDEGLPQAPERIPGYL